MTSTHMSKDLVVFRDSRPDQNLESQLRPPIKHLSWPLANIRLFRNDDSDYSIITRQHIVNARYHSGTHIPHRVSDSVPEQRFNSWTEIGQGNQTHQRKTNSPLEIKTHIRGLIFNTFIPSKETSPMRSLIIPGAKSSLYLGICSQPQQVFLPAHSCVLAWRIPRTEEPFGLQSMGLQRDGHNWATKPTPQSTSVSR